VPECEWNPYLEPPELKDILSSDIVKDDENSSNGEIDVKKQKNYKDSSNHNSTIEDNNVESNENQLSSNQDEKSRFLKSVRRHTKDFPVRSQALSGLKSGSALQKLYANFLQSQNFISWYTPKHAKAERWHKQVVEKRIKEMCMACLIKGKPISEGKLMYGKIQLLLKKK